MWSSKWKPKSPPHNHVVFYCIIFCGCRHRRQRSSSSLRFISFLQIICEKKVNKYMNCWEHNWHYIVALAIKSFWVGISLAFGRRYIIDFDVSSFVTETMQTDKISIWELQFGNFLIRRKYFFFLSYEFCFQQSWNCV